MKTPRKFEVLEPYTDRKNVYPIGEPIESETGCKAHRIVAEAYGIENAQLLAKAPQLEEDDRVWREVVAMLIQALPPRKRSLLCEQLAKIPAVAKTLTPKERELCEKLRA